MHRVGGIGYTAAGKVLPPRDVNFRCTEVGAPKVLSGSVACDDALSWQSGLVRICVSPAELQCRPEPLGSAGLPPRGVASRFTELVAPIELSGYAACDDAVCTDMISAIAKSRLRIKCVTWWTAVRGRMMWRLPRSRDLMLSKRSRAISQHTDDSTVRAAGCAGGLYRRSQRSGEEAAKLAGPGLGACTDTWLETHRCRQVSSDAWVRRSRQSPLGGGRGWGEAACVRRGGPAMMPCAMI